MVTNKVHITKSSGYSSVFLFWPINIVCHGESLPPLWNCLLGFWALYTPGFPPIPVATPFHSPLLNLVHVAVLSTLEQLRKPPWITFWTLCSLNTLMASFILINLNMIYVFVTPTFLIPALTSSLTPDLHIH